MKKILLSISVLIMSCFQLNAQVLPVSSAGLLAYYGFSSNTNDLSGNGNHLTNSAVTSTNDRFFLPNKAMNFPGSGSACLYLTAGNTMSVTGNDIAISFWYKTSIANYAGIIDNSQNSNSYGIDNFNGRF